MGSGQTADVDNPSAPSTAQMRNRRLATVEHSGDVGIHHPAPVIVALRFDAAKPANPGVVHQNIETTVPAGRFVDHRLNRKMVAHVGREGQEPGPA